MAFSARLYEMPAQELRVPRTRTLIEATVSVLPELAHDIVVHNLSSGGALVESSLELWQGSRILLDIPGLGQVPARVAWQGDKFYGCAFLSPIDERKVEAKLASTKVVWADFGPMPARSAADRAPPAALIPLSFYQQAAWQPEVDGVDRFATEDRWSPGKRLGIIFGSAVLCWAIPGTIIALIWF